MVEYTGPDGKRTTKSYSIKKKLADLMKEATSTTDGVEVCDVDITELTRSLLVDARAEAEGFARDKSITSE